MELNTKFDIGQKIHMLPFLKDGVINGITISKNSIEYKVKFVASDEFKYEWFEESELEPIIEGKKIGFNE